MHSLHTLVKTKRSQSEEIERKTQKLSKICRQCNVFDVLYKNTQVNKALVS